MKKLITINQTTHAMLKVVSAAEQKTVRDLASEILDKAIREKSQAIHEQITRLQESQPQPA